MIEKKFRLWSRHKKKFIYSNWKYGMVSFWEQVYLDFNEENEPPNQFTGLKDKHKKDIYECDIVRVDWLDIRYKASIYEVKWDREKAAFDFGAGATSEVSWSHEVIGNSYENIFLLKK